MKITLTSGEIVEVPWSVSGSVGYRATSVELTRKDVTAMLAMLRVNPSGFEAALMQFESRFPFDDLPTPPPLREVPAKRESYQCPACLSNDPTRYVRCHHAACPDGRDPR